MGPQRFCVHRASNRGLKKIPKICLGRLAKKKRRKKKPPKNRTSRRGSKVSPHTLFVERSPTVASQLKKVTRTLM